MLLLFTGAKSHLFVVCLLHAFSFLGLPLQLKTDNGLLYTSNYSKEFWNLQNINNVTGIPYNPQGQTVKEHHHQILKWQTLKIKRECRHPTKSPHSMLYLAMLTLHFFTLKDIVSSAPQKHLARKESQPTV